MIFFSGRATENSGTKPISYQRFQVVRLSSCGHFRHDYIKIQGFPDGKLWVSFSQGDAVMLLQLFYDSVDLL